MSKHDKVAKLKEYIKNFVIKELEKDEELEEVSTTATAGIDGTGTGHYDTPHAFASGSAVGHKSPEAGGYKKVNERLSVDPRKVYGGTGAKQGMVLTAQKGLKKILDLSKKNPSNVFLVSDDNYTNFGPYYVKNGKVAKYTVANPNYDLQKNKVRSLKVPSDVILKFTINESINEGKGVEKVLKMANDHSFGKLGGRTVDALSAGLFKGVYDKASDKNKEKINKMNEKQLYVFMTKLWSKFGRQVKLT